VRELAFAGASPYEIAKAARDAVAMQAPDSVDSLSGILDAIRSFETHDKDFTLEHLLSELALGSVGRPPTEGGGIKVASLHRTKGLQWRKVYLVGLEQGLLPDFRADREVEIAEELRLCFVGITRAEDSLLVTHCVVTRDHLQMPSEFIKAMGL
jgi:DNA helicase-2/ATP-dependent DNA helicase PcrA